MTSTNTFQGLDECSKLSSRVLRPPGGGSSNIFGSSDSSQTSGRSHKMSSGIFGPPEETRDLPKRSNPPGGKGSGIFGEPAMVQHQPRTNPPGGKSSGIFGGPEPTTILQTHPNKPKESGIFHEGEGDSPQKVKESGQQKGNGQEKTAEESSPAKEPTKEPRVPTVDDHLPRLGPRPKAHNKVIQPPGGKSSVAFY